jgi:hypothetical protein
MSMLDAARLLRAGVNRLYWRAAWLLAVHGLNWWLLAGSTRHWRDHERPTEP